MIVIVIVIVFVIVIVIVIVIVRTCRPRGRRIAAKLAGRKDSAALFSRTPSQ